MTDTPPEADALYELDPAEFVAARNALVKQLKADKRKDEAAVVATLRKPSAAAWALNQVARCSPDLVSAALEAGDVLRAASDSAVGGDASELREATAADRAATGAVVDEAVSLLGGRGAAQRQALSATIRAAVLDEGVRALLTAGVLTDDQEEGGFGFGFGLGAGSGDAEIIPFTPRQPKARPKPKAPRRSEEEKEAARRAAEEVAAAEEAEREARRRKASLEAEAERLARKAARLAEVADKAELAAREARADADEAASDAAAAREAADQA